MAGWYQRWYLLVWLVAASGGNILRGMTAAPAVERTVSAGADVACFGQLEAAGRAFLPYSA